MPANTSPLFTLTPVIGNGRWTSSLTANTKSDGTSTGIGTDMVKVLTGGTNGTYVRKIRLTPTASTAASATTATVARFYTSTVTSGATANTDTYMFDERALAAQTAAQTTTQTAYIEIPCEFVLPASRTLLISMHHAAAANTSWAITVFGGDY